MGKAESPLARSSQQGRNNICIQKCWENRGNMVEVGKHKGRLSKEEAKMLEFEELKGIWGIG